MDLRGRRSLGRAISCTKDVHRGKRRGDSEQEPTFHALAMLTIRP